jgi:hypothetical protein
VVKRNARGGIDRSNPINVAMRDDKNFVSKNITNEPARDSARHQGYNTDRSFGFEMLLHSKSFEFCTPTTAPVLDCSEQQLKEIRCITPVAK